MKANQYSEQAYIQLRGLLEQMAMKGFDTSGSMKIIIAVLTIFVDTEDKLNLMLKQVTEAHNAQAVMLIPTINDTIN